LNNVQSSAQSSALQECLSEHQMWIACHTGYTIACCCKACLEIQHACFTCLHHLQQIGLSCMHTTFCRIWIHSAHFPSFNILVCWTTQSQSSQITGVFLSGASFQGDVVPQSHALSAIRTSLQSDPGETVLSQCIKCLPENQVGCCILPQ